MFSSKDIFFAKPSGSYQISRSLRFRQGGGNNAYLSRTPASNGNTSKFTFSCWIKRGTIGSGIASPLFGAYNGTVSNATDDGILINGDTFTIWSKGGVTGSGGWYRNTTAVLRDPSAWYHLQVYFDTSQSTDATKLRMYINGVEQTSYTAAGTIAAFNYLNTTNVQRIGQDNGSGGPFYLDGYLAEVNFIDGQALDPTSFGAYDTTTGVWGPKKYTGTYGTNGFYIPFTDTTGSVGGNDTYNKVLLHGDGANNSTSILDSSWSNRKTFTAAGGAKISTTQSKFGGSSIYFDGANNTAVTCPSNADLNPSGDFTIDCWVYFTSSSTQQAVVIKTDSGGVSPYLIYTSGTSLIYYASSNNSSWDIFSGTSFGSFSLNTWTHIAIVRSGNTYYGFVNGVRTTLGTSSLTPTAQTTTFRLGHYTSTLGVMNGYIDEFRFSNGIARWTADFSSSLPTRYTGYIGADISGNYNDWDTYNISTSSGTTYDSMIDTPTPYADGGNGRGNYAVLNPLSYAGSAATITNGNLSFSNSASGVYRSTLGMTGTKIYWEITQSSTVNASNPIMYGAIGLNGVVAHQASSQSVLAYTDGSSKAFYLTNSSGISSTVTPSVFTMSSGDILQIAYDGTTGKIWIGKNNTWYDGSGGTTGNPATGSNPVFTLSDLNNPMAPGFDHAGVAYTATLNCGQQPFTYTPPSGYSALNTQNLP
jgi:Concanavalin A-like lectin/glucanases superfamily